MEYRIDCIYFRGDIPCKFHKSEGVHCQACIHYEPIRKRILIIKLGARGDVIRTTPLLRKLRGSYPGAEISWLTYTPEVLSAQWVDTILTFDLKNILWLKACRFDYLYNLDKDPEACALADLIQADQKTGFGLKIGKCYPLDQRAEGKYLTGLFDDKSKANTKSYQEEIFEICGFEFRGEKYILEKAANPVRDWEIREPKPLVGLNTGCGQRWVSRLWPQENWIDLARRLKREGYGVLLLGGENEHQRNTEIARASGASYVGHFPLQQFINLVDECDMVVTGVTMATHIAIGLGKKIVLFNNTFNSQEFELYGLGEILEPEYDCTCYYSSTCPNNCMQYLRVDRVLEACRRQLVP